MSHIAFCETESSLASLGDSEIGQMLGQAENFELLLKAGTNGVYVWDVLEDSWFWSPRLRRMLGVPSETPASIEVWKDMVEPSDVNKVMYELYLALSNTEKDTFFFDFTGKHKDGHLIPMLTRGCVKRDETGEVVKMVGVCADQTVYHELKAVSEELLIQSKVGNSKVGPNPEFLHLVGDQVQSSLDCLNDVAMHLENASDCPEAHQMSQVLSSSITQLSSLLDDVFAVAHQDRKALMPTVEEFDLESVFDQLIALKTLRCRQKGLKLNVSRNFANGSKYYGDKNRIRQAIYNALVNALKLTDEGSITCNIQCRPTAGLHDEIVVQVLDTGGDFIKWEKGDFSEGFEGYSMMPTTIKIGTSWSLVGAKNLVEELNGSFEVSGNEARGNKVELRFLLKPVKLRKAYNNCLHCGLAKPDRSVLVVDDDIGTRDWIANHLLKKGYKVNKAGCGQFGLIEMQSRQFDFVVIGCSLPDMFPASVVKRARSMSLGEVNTKFIALTEENEAAHRRALMEEGFDSCLGKPLNLSELDKILTESTCGAPCSKSEKIRDEEYELSL